MTEISPSRKDIVSRAISTLVEGICKENNCYIRFSGIEWADAVPVSCLGTFRDGLKAVQLQMNQQVDKIIGRLAHRWNLVTASIHKLPLEILVIIFREFGLGAPGAGVNTSLFDLLLVCRSWYDAIIGSPRLWRYFDGAMPHKIARLVIDRSQLRPVSINWLCNHIYPGPNPLLNLANFLDLATQISKRVRSINIRRSPVDHGDLRELLQAPTPALETLQVQIVSSGSGEDRNSPPGEFTLSEGRHLKHLSLNGITTPLNHPRLSNLITLALFGWSVPKSPTHLLQILSSLQQLEELDIQYLQNSTKEVRASAPILLPHLKKLALSHLPGVYTATILASIYTPSCFDVEVVDGDVDEEKIATVEALDAVIWRPGNYQAASLLGWSSSRPEGWHLTIQKFVRSISLRSPMSLHGDRQLHFGRKDICRFMTQLATTVSQLPSPPAVGLVDIADEEGRIPVDLLLWSEVLETLVVRGQNACRSVLQQLSQRHVIPGTGEVDWVCRRLSNIRLEYCWSEGEDEATDGRALLSLVRQRWSGESTSGFAGTARPSSFEVYCKEANFPNLWSLKDEIAHILPSFKLIGNGF